MLTDFADLMELPERETSIDTITSGELDIEVYASWYPPNPHGTYMAYYHDQEKGAAVTLVVDSLSEENYRALDSQEIADTLVAYMASAPN